MRASAIPVLVVVGFGGSACFDARVASDAALSCATQDDCPTELRCVTALGRCISRLDDDGQPPTVTLTSAPTALGPGQRGEVAFVVDEPLAFAPAVTAARFSLDVTGSASGGFVANVGADTLPEGSAALAITVADAGGNAAQANVGAIRIDRTPPTLVAADLPGRILGVGPAVINVVASEDLSGAVMSAQEADIVDVVIDGNRATFTVTPTFSVSPGGLEPLPSVVTVDGVELVDAVGNRASVAVAGSVVFDDQGPQTVIASATPHVSRVAGFDVVTVVAEVDDAVSVTARLGALEDECAVAAGIATCTLSQLDLPAPAFGGAVGVAVFAFDEVGNAGFAGTTVSVDVDAPTADDAAIELRPRPGSSSTRSRALGLGGIVALAFSVVDDGPAAPLPPTVALVGPDGTRLPFDDTLTVTLDRAVPPGDYAVVAVVSDVVGNVAERTLGTVLVDEVIPSPCVLVDDTGAPLCTDFDGDSAAGVSEGCADATDCDDADPAVGPAMPEVPGNGLDDDCAGDGDLPLDEDSAIFVVPGASGGMARAAHRLGLSPRR